MFGFRTSIIVFDNFNTFRKKTFNFFKIGKTIFAEFGFENEGPHKYQLGDYEYDPLWKMTECAMWSVADVRKWLKMRFKHAGAKSR